MGVASEARLILALALPSCIASLTFISGMLALVFIGPYGTDAIAGAGLGFMWTNVTGQSLIYGTGMGLATLSSQAFGAKNYRRVGVLWQRQCVYQWLLCVVVAAIWWNTEGILMSFGQPPRVAANAATWARWQLPGLPAMPMLNSMNAFLQSQRIVRPSAVVALLSNFLVTVPLCWYLTQPGSLGFAGAPLSIAVGQLINSSIMYVVAPRVISHPCWGPWTRKPCCCRRCCMRLLEADGAGTPR